MGVQKNNRGFSLIEVIVAVAVFAIFALGIYGAINLIFRIVYQSRMVILETALLSEQLEVARNLPYENIGVVGGVPSGVLQPTQTIVRDGASFTVVTTVRNVDDPFDGTVGGSPNDLSPADFKLVEMSAICIGCVQKRAQVMSTLVGPKGLEGSTKNGALFIHVFDAAGQPVSGATVQVSNTTVSPPISLSDTTDASGYLRVIDTPTGTASYAIRVTKNGYSTDYTVTSSAQVANPIKPPANVVSQEVTDISFSIDQLSAMTVHTVNQACAAVGNTGFSVTGAKLLGTGPSVYKYNQSFTTDGSGNKSLSSLEWDTYDFALTGGSYDIAGSIPQEPLALAPGDTQDVTLVLKNHSANSFLVKVADAGTKLPLSGATAQLTGSSYDTSYITGLGYLRQTDWSGGSGATSFVEGRYFSDDGNITNNSPAGDVLLKKVGQNYRLDGQLESATFDFGSAVNFNNIVLNPSTQPAQSGSRSLLIQVATSNSSTPVSWNFLGPDGTASTYYSITSTLMHSSLSGKRYLRYRAFLHTDNNKYTPRLSEIAFTYTNTCIPPGQAFFDSLSAGTYTLTLSAPGYITATTTFDIAGNDDATVYMAEQ